MALDLLKIYQAYRGGRDDVRQNRLADMDRDFRQQQLALQERNLEGDEAFRRDQLDLQRSKAAELPASVQEYQYGLKDPAFAQYQQNLKRAGANSVNIDMKGEGEFSKQTGKLQAEYFDTIIKEGANASNMIANVTALRDIGGRLTTGKSAEILNALGPYAQLAGVDIKGLGDMQAFDAIVSRVAPTLRVPGSGATSDFEMKQFLQSLPSLGKTPEGNALIQDSLESIAQHRKKAAAIATNAQIGKISRQDAMAQINALPDPLTLWKQSGGGKQTQTTGAGPKGDQGAAPRVRVYNPNTGNLE